MLAETAHKCLARFCCAVVAPFGVVLRCRPRFLRDFGIADGWLYVWVGTMQFIAVLSCCHSVRPLEAADGLDWVVGRSVGR